MQHIGLNKEEMTTNKKLFLHKILTSVIGCMFVVYSANAANVSSRGGQRATQAAARTNTQKATATQKTAEKATATKTVAKTKIENELEEKLVIENKSSQFDNFLIEVAETQNADSDQDLAEKIRKQREAFNAQSAKEVATTKTKTALSTGKNDCDQKLRACMKTKCGEDFTKCAGDTDTIWGDKLDLCRQNITCTGTEYNLFTKEIKADRDLNQQLAGYKSIVDCGNRYNDCIITQCGTTFSNCLGKSAGDTAIKKCEKIANECKQQDSGMPARVAEVMGNLRVNAEELVARDEQRLYDLRDKMRETCGRLGALFDDRTLDCVYSINFYGGENGDLMASKKAYAGTSFNCDADWFGVDVTTFMENAARLTKSTKSATSAALGAGVGVGVGALTSGAIGRAMDTHKAKKELDEAENGTKAEQRAAKKQARQDKKDQKKADKAAEKKLKEENKTQGGDRAETKNAKRDCKNSGGDWKNDKCNCGIAKTLVGTHCVNTAQKEAADKTTQEQLQKSQQEANKKMQGHILPAPDISTTLKAKQEAKRQEQEDNIKNIPQTRCEKVYNGTWTGKTCQCPNNMTWTSDSCIEPKTD